MIDVYAPLSRKRLFLLHWWFDGDTTVFKSSSCRMGKLVNSDLDRCVN